MVNKFNSRFQMKKCKPAKVKRFSFFDKDVMVYSCYPPSSAAYFNVVGPPPKKSKAEASPKFKHKSDLTHYSKGGKLLGYLTYDPNDFGRGLYITTTDGKELDPLECEKRHGLGYIWTDEDMLRMINSKDHPPRKSRGNSMITLPYLQPPNVMMPPRQSVCPFPPKIVAAAPPELEDANQPHLSNSKVSFRSAKKAVCAENDVKKFRNVPVKRQSLPLTTVPTPLAVTPYSPGPAEPQRNSFSCTCLAPYPPFIPGPEPPLYPSTLPCPGPPIYPVGPPIASPFQPQPPPPPMAGIPVHFVPPPDMPPPRYLPPVPKYDAGNQACIITCDKEVETTAEPPKLPESSVLPETVEQSKVSKLGRTGKLDTAEKEVPKHDEGCAIDEGPCGINDDKLAKRYLAFLRGSNPPPGQRGYINETVDSGIKEKKEPEKVMITTSTQYENDKSRPSLSKNLNSSVPPNTNRIVVLRRSPTTSPQRDVSRRNLTVNRSPPRQSADNPNTKRRLDPPESQESLTDDRQKKWYFDGFRQPAPKNNKCVIS